MMISKAIAGDYYGDVNIQVGTLWHGPSAKKFKGLHFVDEGTGYEPENIKYLVYLSNENIKSFLDSSPSGDGDRLAFNENELFDNDSFFGKHTIVQLGIEFRDGRKIILVATDNRVLQCLLLFAEAEGIIE